MSVPVAGRSAGASREHGMRHSLFIPMALVMLAACAIASPARIRSDSTLELAQRLQLREHYSRALLAYARVLRDNPTLVAARIGRGQSNLALGRTRAAVTDFTQWIKLDASDPYAAIWLYIAAVRSHVQDARSALADPSATTKEWPRAIIRYLAGQTDWETLFDKALVATGPTRDRELCEAALFYGENLLAAGKMSAAMGGFALASRARCASQSALRALALSEYQRLYHAGYRERPTE